MSDTHCTATTAAGQPCRAHPRPGHPFCALHDPELAETVAEGRGKGGAAPRRRFRRYPRLLDHLHVAELLGELFMETVNHPEQVDSKRLHATTNLARTLLKAVGTPPTFLHHRLREEPSPLTGHLLRLYPPVPDEVDTLLAAGPPLEPPAGDPETTPAEAADSVPWDHETVRIGDLKAWNKSIAYVHPDSDPSSDPTTGAPDWTAATDAEPTPGSAAPHPRSEAACPERPDPSEEEGEQDLDRCWTGPPAIEPLPGLSAPDSLYTPQPLPSSPDGTPLTDEPAAPAWPDIESAAREAHEARRPPSLRPYRPVATLAPRTARPLSNPFG